MVQKLLGMVLGRVGGGQQAALLQAAMGVLGGSGGGGGGGLGAILGKLQGGGLGAQADSWVGTGANQAVNAKQLRGAIGEDDLGRIAQQAGVSKRAAAGGLAKLMPKAVDQMTPDGQVQEGNPMDQLGGILGKLGIG